MPKVAYTPPAWLRRFLEKGTSVHISHAPMLETIIQARDVLESYETLGYHLTLRQLYYQMVAPGLIANTDESYNRLIRAVTKGRMWGLIDWYSVVDRGRNYITQPAWDTHVDVMKTAARSFHVDRWANSPVHLEVWAEKQSVEGVVEQACNAWGVGHIVCQGYMGAAEMWEAAQRALVYQADGKPTAIIILTDHDQAGFKIVSAIESRFSTFGVTGVEVRRIAVTKEQAATHRLVPAPVQSPAGYVKVHGDVSWEIEALNPHVLNELIQMTIKSYADSCYYSAVEREQILKNELTQIAESWATSNEAEPAADDPAATE